MRLAGLVDPDRSITNGVRGPQWQDSIFKLIRLQDCKDWIVDKDNAASISFKQFEENRRCKLEVNDIVVAIGGYVGNASVLTEPTRAVIGQHSAILPFFKGGRVDSRFLLAYLNSKFAEEIFQRFVSGTVQPGVNLEDLRDIPAPVPDKLSQLYIGGKVRQAERLRAGAKIAEAIALNFHVSLIPEQCGLDFNKRIRKVASAEMKERMDPHFYPAVVEQYLKHGNVHFERLGRLCVTVINGQTQPEATGVSTCQQISVANLSRNFVKGGTIKVEPPSDRNRLIRKHDLLMCNAAHSKDYVGRQITYWHGDAEILPSTEVMIIRADREQIPASYIRSYLLTKLGYVQLQSTIRGITAHSYPSDVKLLEIPVPQVPAELRDQWFGYDEQMVQAGLATETASLLTAAAKLLVESLIEGQVTESQLIDAQQALEAGDDSQDRAILARLTTDGLDGTGEPLFPDLDQLYDLLERAKPEAEA